jgi:FlaA1/EpsC-like NDP-sugar epimerase
MSRLSAFLLGLRNRHFFFIDAGVLFIIPYIALALRLDSYSTAVVRYGAGLWRYSILLMVVYLAVFYSMGLYSRFWRYASIEDMVRIGEAVSLATLIVLVVFFGPRVFWPPSLINPPGLIGNFYPVVDLPRSLPLLTAMLILFHVAGSRFGIRLAERTVLPSRDRNSKRVLIVGAGDAGAMIVRELERNPHLGMTPVGFIDDDVKKLGLRIHNLPVMGTREDIPKIVVSLRVKQVIIAMPTAPGKTIREIAAICDKASVQTKTMPGIYELLGGTVSVNQLRDVAIEDLLRREPIETNIAAVAELLQGRRVLITGGGGSIGSELGRQILRCRPAELFLLGHGENSIFDIHSELSLMARSIGLSTNGQSAEFGQFGSGRPPTRVVPVIADIRSADRIQLIFDRYRPEIVFHAAAHKHVPLMEANPAEAVTNNIVGTRNVLRAAAASDVQRFVMISTDKAVNPTSVMGASKRTAELLVHQAAEASSRPYVTVRFGNVLGSRGSVVLTFKQQIAAGGPITVTDPNMRRYFMTIPEAVQLVLQASVLGSGGEVFVLDMGEPVRIMDLARDMIELSGLEVGRDIDIEITAPRPGEKLYEELFIPGEDYRRTVHEKIFIAANAGSLVPKELDGAVHTLENLVRRDDGPGIVEQLQRLIPDYRPASTAGD